MAENTQLFRKVAILGIGLIGGSMGIVLRKNKLAGEVVGVARQHASLVHALKNGAVDHGTHDLKKAVENADLVILSTPVKTITQMLSSIGGYLKRGCIVTDVGSTKAAIVDAAQKSLPPHAYFVGSHPLAGSEKKGVMFARGDLFNDSVCIVTPNEKTNKQAAEKVKELWVKLGTTVKVVTPAEHDKILAYISHVPHLLAYALIEAVPQEYLGYATQGLKDTTRIAASDPEMWNDICLTNSKNITEAVDGFVKILAVLRKSIVSQDDRSLIEHLKKSKSKRDGIDRG